MWFILLGCHIEEAIEAARGAEDTPNPGPECVGTLDEQGRIVVEEDVKSSVGLCADGCARVFGSDVVLNGVDEEGPLELGCVEEVEGTLSVVGTNVTELSFPALRSVGTLTVSSNPSLAQASFPALERVVKGVTVDVADTLDLSRLETAQSVVVQGRAVWLDSLVDVAADLWIVGVESVWLPSLLTVEGTLSAELDRSLEAPVLRSVGTVTVDAPGTDLRALETADTIRVLEAVVLPSLVDVRALTVSAEADLPLLQSVSTLAVTESVASSGPLAPALTRVETLSITDNPSLTDLSGLSALESVWSLQMRRNDLLEEVSFPALGSAHTIEVREHLRLGHLAFDSLVVAERVLVADTPLSSLAAFSRLPRLEQLTLLELPLDSLAGLEALTRVDTMVVTGLPGLANLSGPPLETLGSLQITRTGIVALGLDPDEVGEIVLRENGEITDLRGFAGVSRLGSLDVGDNGLTSTAGLSALTGLEHLRIANEAGLLSLDEGPAEATLVSLTLSGGALVDVAGLSGLTEIGTLEIISTPIADLAGLAQVQQIEKATIRNNDALRTLDGLSRVSGIEGNLSIDANRHLYDIEGLAPYWIGGSLKIVNNLDLATSQADALVERVELGDIRGEITISGNGG